MNTHESYVSLETAKLLKEAGFDWECQYYIHAYTQEIVYSIKTHKKLYCNEDVDFSAPTINVAQRWLREVKECAVIVETHNVQAACVSAYVYCIYPTDATHPCKHINGFAEDHCFNTYEEALEAGVKKALEIILEREETK